VKPFSARIVALLCSLSLATVAAVEIWPSHQQVLTSDRNGDGRSNVWRRYDTQGRLTEIDRDTNFDGHPDIEEYYQRGVLIRRESDRNFNGQIDLIEDFDPVTQGQTRSVADVDYDGTADLLVLFQDGRPVFSKQIQAGGKPSQNWRATTAVDRRLGNQHLAALINPFESDTAIRGLQMAPNGGGSVGLSTAGGLPRARFSLLGRLVASAPLVDTNPACDALAVSLLHASRAPPIS